MTAPVRFPPDCDCQVTRRAARHRRRRNNKTGSVKRGVSMSITWEEPGRGEWVKVERTGSTAWKKTAAQIAALAVLAVVGATAGAGYAAWKLGDGDPAAAVEANAAPGATPSPVRTAAMAERMAQPRDIAAAPAVREAVDADPAARASLFPEGETAIAADAGSSVGANESASPAEPTRDVTLAAMPASLETLPADAPPTGIDVAETASILSPGEPVAVADTAEEAAKLEAMMADESLPPEPDRMAAASADNPAAPFASDGKPLTPAQADKYVNLRAGPDNESEVLEIIPANAELLAEENCTHWCAVSHDGLKGYVYKTFIRR